MTTTTTLRTDAPLPLPRPTFRTPPTQVSYDLPPTVCNTTRGDPTTSMGGNTGSMTTARRDTTTTIITPTSTTIGGNIPSATTSIPRPTTNSNTTRRGADHNISSTSAAGSGVSTVVTETPHSSTTKRGGSTTTSTTTLSTTTAPSPTTRGNHTIVTPTHATSLVLADVARHLRMPTTHHELVTALASYDRSGDGAWDAVLSTITTHADRNYVSHAYSYFGHCRSFMSSVKSFEEVTVGLSTVQKSRFCDQLKLMKIWSTRHVLIHVLAEVLNDMYSRMELTTTWFRQCSSELESQDTVISTHIRSSLDSLTHLAQSTIEYMHDVGFRTGCTPHPHRIASYVSSIESASSVRMWLERSQIHYQDAVSLVRRLAPRLVQWNMAATTIQLWQRRTLRARYLATAARRRIAATTIQLWQRRTNIARHLAQQTRRRLAATTIQLWQRRTLLLRYLDGITQRRIHRQLLCRGASAHAMAIQVLHPRPRRSRRKPRHRHQATPLSLTTTDMPSASASASLSTTTLSMDVLQQGYAEPALMDSGLVAVPTQLSLEEILANQEVLRKQSALLLEHMNVTFPIETAEFFKENEVSLHDCVGNGTCRSEHQACTVLNCINAVDVGIGDANRMVHCGKDVSSLAKDSTIPTADIDSEEAHSICSSNCNVDLSHLSLEELLAKLTELDKESALWFERHERMYARDLQFERMHDVLVNRHSTSMVQPSAAPHSSTHVSSSTVVPLAGINDSMVRVDDLLVREQDNGISIETEEDMDFHAEDIESTYELCGNTVGSKDGDTACLGLGELPTSDPSPLSTLTDLLAEFDILRAQAKNIEGQLDRLLPMSKADNIFHHPLPSHAAGINADSHLRVNTLEYIECKPTMDVINAIDIATGVVDAINVVAGGVAHHLEEDDSTPTTVGNPIATNDDATDCGVSQLERSCDVAFGASPNGDGNIDVEIGFSTSIFDGDRTLGVATLYEIGFIPTTDGVNGAAAFNPTTDDSVATDGVNGADAFIPTMDDINTLDCIIDGAVDFSWVVADDADHSTHPVGACTHRGVDTAIDVDIIGEDTAIDMAIVGATTMVDVAIVGATTMVDADINDVDTTVDVALVGMVATTIDVGIIDGDVVDDTDRSPHHAGRCTDIGIAAMVEVNDTGEVTVVDVDMWDATTMDDDDDNVATWTALSTMSTTIDELCTEMGLSLALPSTHTNIVMDLCQAFSLFAATDNTGTLPPDPSHCHVDTPSTNIVLPSPSTDCVLPTPPPDIVIPSSSIDIEPPPKPTTTYDSNTIHRSLAGLLSMELLTPGKVSMRGLWLEYGRWRRIILNGLVPPLRVTSVLAAPFNITGTTGLSRPPPEPPPYDPVTYFLMDHHYVLFLATRIAAVLLSGGARSTAELSLSLGAGWNLEACSTAQLGLFLGYGFSSGRARLIADFSLPLCYGISAWVVHLTTILGLMFRIGWCFWKLSSPVDASTCHFLESSPAGASTCYFLESSPVDAYTCHSLKSSPVDASTWYGSSPVGASTCHPLESSPCCASTCCLLELRPSHRFRAYKCHLLRSRHLGHCSWQPILDTIDAINVDNGVVNLEEDKCTPTVDFIIDDSDSDFVWRSNPLECGSDADDFDAHIDDDEDVEVDNKLSIFAVAVSTIHRVVPLDADDTTGNMDDECKPTAEGVYDTTHFFDGNDFSTVHPDPIDAGIITNRVDTTIDSTELAVDHCCSGCDDVSIADSTDTIGTTSMPTWMDLSTRDGMTTRSLECGHSLMELESGNGLMMDSWLDHWYLVPCLRASNALVALFGVVLAVGWARAPTENPPSNVVDYLIDRPFVHATAIIELSLSIGAGIQNGRALLIVACILSLGYTLYYGGEQSTARFGLPLGYSWYSGGERLPDELCLSLNADRIYGTRIVCTAVSIGSVHCDIFHHTTCWCLWPFVCITDGTFGLGFLSSLRRGYSIGSSYKKLGPLYSVFFVDTTYQQNIHWPVTVDTSSFYYECNENRGCTDNYDNHWYEVCWCIEDWDDEFALGLFVLWFLLPWYNSCHESSVLGYFIIGLIVSWYSLVLDTFICLWLIAWHFASIKNDMLATSSLWKADYEGYQQSITPVSHSDASWFGFVFSFPLGDSFPIHPLLASLATSWIVGG